jgi:hypothetical protein
LAFNLFAVIAAAIAGVLFSWMCLAIFGTKVDVVVSTAVADAFPICLSDFVRFL